MGILCFVAWLWPRVLSMAAWSPLAPSSSPSFFSTVAPWAETAALPGKSALLIPANAGNSFWESGCSVNKLRRQGHWGHFLWYSIPEESQIKICPWQCGETFKTTFKLWTHEIAIKELSCWSHWPGQNQAPSSGVVCCYRTPELLNHVILSHDLKR